MAHWSDIYPHNIYQSVLLLDGKIYNWKIGGHSRPNKYEWKMWMKDFDKIDRMEVKENVIVVNNSEEHNQAFENKEWFTQFQEHEDKLGSSVFFDDNFPY